MRLGGSYPGPHPLNDAPRKLNMLRSNGWQEESKARSAKSKPHPTDLRVAYDHRVFAYQQHGGVSRYFARLVEHLAEFQVRPKVISPLFISERLLDLPKSAVWGRFVSPSPRHIRAAAKLGEGLHRPLAWLFSPRVIHETEYHWRRIAPADVPIVTTVHDMIAELFTDRLSGGDSYASNKKASIARAATIICISENTRRDLLSLYPECEDRTVVIRLGFDAPSGAGTALPIPHGRPYMLYVGQRRDFYKNFSGLVAAYAQSRCLRDELDVVCVGGGSFQPHERELMKRWGVVDKFFQQTADDLALQNWYRHARVFVYPSLYEGFGIPPLEAMAADCPAVCMHASSVPEVCGDAAEYAVPGETDSLRAAIEKVAFSAERAAALREAGRKRLKLFSWRECARQTSEVYKAMT